MVHFKWVNCMVRELYLNKVAAKTKNLGEDLKAGPDELCALLVGDGGWGALVLREDSGEAVGTMIKAETKASSYLFLFLLLILHLLNG